MSEKFPHACLVRMLSLDKVYCIVCLPSLDTLSRYHDPFFLNAELESKNKKNKAYHLPRVEEYLSESLYKTYTHLGETLATSLGHLWVHPHLFETEEHRHERRFAKCSTAECMILELANEVHY